MIQSLLIANRGKIACRFIRTHILPGTGRWREATEGSGEGVRNTSTLRHPDSGPSDPYGATSPFRRGF
jgi:hypothetical protein